jgi:SAM-dependent methyltransferase
MTHRFVTRNFEVLDGESARLRLRTTNDREFVVADQGIPRVSRERWKSAQDAECHGWLEIWRDSQEDRNSLHLAMFDYLAMLHGRRFAKVIELGCGPFTNLRLMLMTLAADEVHLLDPLLDSYRSHPHCAYADGALRLVDGRRVPIAGAYSSSIEEFDNSHRFDVVVLINVIEHCFDVHRLFDRVWTMLNPGGLLLFHDRYFDHDDVAQNSARDYDTAHPLKVDRRIVDGFLGRFAEVFRRAVTTSGAVRLSPPGDMVYFVGVRR